ncbi:hypothetical protein GCM10027053_51710 [Intrasporangium mesophilum]
MAVRVSDKPNPAPCPSCGADTLTAWRDGLYEQVHVDPLELTRRGELEAVLTGRRTFAHWGGPNGGLDHRRAEAITRWPAGEPSRPVRPEHRCGARPPDHLPVRRSALTEHPPF